jgi:hypothetical protein
VAYADSTSDLPMLEAVGFPVAVNPETRLAALARKRGWLVENWPKASGAPPVRLPLAPPTGPGRREGLLARVFAAFPTDAVGKASKNGSGRVGARR